MVSASWEEDDGFLRMYVAEPREVWRVPGKARFQYQLAQGARTADAPSRYYVTLVRGSEMAVARQNVRRQHAAWSDEQILEHMRRTAAEVPLSEMERLGLGLATRGQAPRYGSGEKAHRPVAEKWFEAVHWDSAMEWRRALGLPDLGFHLYITIGFTPEVPCHRAPPSAH